MRVCLTALLTALTICTAGCSFGAAAVRDDEGYEERIIRYSVLNLIQNEEDFVTPNLAHARESEGFTPEQLEQVRGVVADVLKAYLKIPGSTQNLSDPTHSVSDPWAAMLEEDRVMGRLP